LVPTIRDACPEDAGRVATVHVRAWQAAYRGILPDAELDALDPAERARRYTFGDRTPGTPRTLVALEGDSVLGFATVTRCADDSGRAGELQALYVDPARWHSGVGRALLAAAEARLQEEGFAVAVLWVFVGNERAERFYRAAGWRGDGTVREQTFWGFPVAVTRYRRALSAR
jgi:ribosomal protein S18 acetylase RimI-like enzyme